MPIESPPGGRTLLSPELEEARRHGRAPLIPPLLWRGIVPLLGAFAALVGGLGTVVVGHSYPLRPERWVMSVLDRIPVRERVWKLGIWLGSPRLFAAIVVALALWALVRRSWPELLACAAVPGAVVLVENVLKPLYGRTYVNVHFAFPSGTCTGVAAWTTLTWLLAVPAIRHAAARVGLAVALVGLMGLTALAVIASHWHYPFDAVAGVATGMFVVLGWASVIDLATGAHHRDSAGLSRGGGASRGDGRATR